MWLTIPRRLPKTKLEDMDMRMKFTEKTIASLKLKAGQTDLFAIDEGLRGFTCRVRDNGSKTFLYQYKVAGRSRKVVIGSANVVSLADAKEIAGRYHARVMAGGDPFADKIDTVASRALSVGDLVNKYIAAQKPDWRPRTRIENDRYLRDKLKPLHRVPVITIDQRAVAGFLTDVEGKLRAEGRRGVVTVNRLRATLSALFTWAISEGLTTTNPVAATRKRLEKSRSRVLSPSELHLIWRAAGDERFGVIVKLLMLTGQRLREISHLQWKEIDFDAGTITWSPSRTKNATSHCIPMTSTVRKLLSAYTPGTAVHVFARPNAHKDTPFDDMSRHKRLLDERVTALNNGQPPEHWTLHDLRRSAATAMADIGIQPHIIEAVLNHQSGHKSGVAGNYNRSNYAAEKATALARWDEHLTSIVHDRRSVVTPMRGRA